MMKETSKKQTTREKFFFAFFGWQRSVPSCQAGGASQKSQRIEMTVGGAKRSETTQKEDIIVARLGPRQDACHTSWRAQIET